MSHRVSTDIAGRSRKGRALLAGGAVLGLGAVATLAAWSDDVWVVSSFITTPFNIQAAVDHNGTAWADYPISPGGDLDFPLEPSNNMLPGDTVYAPLNLQVTTGGGAVVSLNSLPQEPDGNNYDKAFFNALTLTLYAVSPTTCNASGTNGESPISDKFNGVGLNDTDQIGADLVTLTSENDPKGICFKITLPSDVGPEVRTGKTEKLIWSLHATPF